MNPRPSAYKALALPLSYRGLDNSNLLSDFINLAEDSNKSIIILSKGMEYEVSVVIEPKPYLSDPEGETILRDLIAKGGYSMVKKVRSAKMLRIIVEADNAEEAEEIVRRLCDDLRIYNPVASNCKVKCIG